VFILPLKLGKVDGKTTSEDNDIRHVTNLSRNSVLKTSSQVTEAKKHLKALNLFLHHDQSKSWDTYKMIEMLSKADRNSFILDVGCNDSPILPMLKRLGFRNLYGCDLVLKPRYSRNFMNAAYSLYKREYKPIVEMHNDKPLNLSIQNLEATNYQNDMFDFVTSLSVIEHGIDVQRYFIEMNRILKKGGFLMTSTDYWPEKIINTKCVLSQGTPDKIFDRNEIEYAITIGEKSGLKLIEPIDYTHMDKVVHWKETGLDYTFIFFAMKK
jgi:2-polyprenyl-3-methyl-5-hydroxy-6-metoxy-1,4-benzoquinol methylase